MKAAKHPDESSSITAPSQRCSVCHRRCARYGNVAAAACVSAAAMSPPLCQVQQSLPVHGSPPVMTILHSLSRVCIRIAASAAAAVAAAFLHAVLRGVADAVHTPDSDLLLAAVAALLCADGCVQAAAMLSISAVQQLALYCVPWLEAYAQQQTAQYGSGTAAAVCCEARRLLTRIS